ncbi:unnamed protein product [Penicillium pancosmium]
MIPCFLLGSLVAYFLVTIIYRVHIHPLSKFPGPRLAALTGLYEIYFAAWGTGSFEDEIDRMHEEYGPVVRITPDEVHVQDQFYNAQHADSWIKGTKAIHSGRHQSGYTSPSFQIRKRSMSRVRSILQVEVHQIIRELVRKHQVSRGFSWRLRSFASIPSLRGGSVDTIEMGDLEDGHQMRSSIPNPMARN